MHTAMTGVASAHAYLPVLGRPLLLVHDKGAVACCRYALHDHGACHACSAVQIIMRDYFPWQLLLAI